MEIAEQVATCLDKFKELLDSLDSLEPGVRQQLEQFFRQMADIAEKGIERLETRVERLEKLNARL